MINVCVDTIEVKARQIAIYRCFYTFAIMKSALLVFLGGGMGSVLRYTTGRILPAMGIGTSFPLSILLVNVVASGVLGVMVGYALSRTLSNEAHLLIGVGFCGGLSTFSSFSNDTLMLVQNGRAGAAMVHIGLNVSLCLLASFGGLVAGGRI